MYGSTFVRASDRWVVAPLVVDVQSRTFQCPQVLNAWAEIRYFRVVFPRIAMFAEDCLVLSENSKT